jgi:hypothetical protein
MYHQSNIKQIYNLPTIYSCVLCGSENKEQLFPYTTVTLTKANHYIISFHSVSNISLSTLFSKTFCLCSSFNVTNQDLHQQKQQEMLSSVYFIFLCQNKTNGELQRSCTDSKHPLISVCFQFFQKCSLSSSPPFPNAIRSAAFHTINPPPATPTYSQIIHVIIKVEI